MAYIESVCVQWHALLIKNFKLYSKSRVSTLLALLGPSISVLLVLWIHFSTQPHAPTARDYELIAQSSPPLPLSLGEDMFHHPPVIMYSMVDRGGGAAEKIMDLLAWKHVSLSSDKMVI
jgi:hypothetical protein